MIDDDLSFAPSEGLDHALELLRQAPGNARPLPDALPEQGTGEIEALDKLAPHVFSRAAHLSSHSALAHMDPPTPWVTWATALWNASLNQNLLHEATSPFATEAEERVINWLKGYFGMAGGHFCAGSSLANLTALWAARDVKGARRVVTSESAHLSVDKATRILGLKLEKVPVDEHERLDVAAVNALDDACLVLTAGTTATGSIDPLHLAGQAAWTHVDAAWAGPLRLSTRYSHLLEGIEWADSVAVSTHKWLFQPKDSAIIFFKALERANEAIGFGGAYLAAPNIGVQGSRSAAAIPLLATLLAWGRNGMVDRIERTMSIAQRLAIAIAENGEMALWANPETAITVFRPTSFPVETFMRRVPTGMFSTCMVQDARWIRSVAANPMADIEHICKIINKANRANA